MLYGKLDKARRIIVRDRKINIVLLSIWSFFFCLCLWATFSNIKAVWVLLLLLVLILFLIKCIVGNNHLLKQFSSIAEMKTLKKTDQVKLSCPKVVFLGYPERHSFMPRYYGITLADCNKNKYYYFFDDCMWYDKASIAKILGKFSRELSIQCYENTSIIKTIENDPYFVRIQYGAFRE